MGLLWLFGLGGLAVTGIGAWLAFKTWHLVQHGILTEGRYVDAVWETTGTDSQVTQHGLIEFETANGERVRFQGRLGTPFEGRRVGQPVRVRYLPAAPQEAVVASFLELWMPALIFLGVGIGWVVVAGVTLLVRGIM